MRKIVFSILLFLAVVTAATSQTIIQTVKADDLKTELKGCEQSLAKYRDRSGDAWPCYLSADKSTTFYVRKIYIANGVYKYEFCLLEKDGRTYAGN